MKKILSVLLAIMMTVSVSAAQPAKSGSASKSNAAKKYTYSVGLVAGLGIGVQFKDMVTDHFTIIEEFGYFTCIPGAASTWGAGYSGAIDNLVLAYQGKAAEGQGIRLDYYVGGQLKAGYASGDGGVIGFGAAGGIEAKMLNAPIAFSFDFRPGYALGMYATGWGGGPALDHMFDYSFNLGVRYTF